MPTPTDNASLERAIKELELMQSVQKNDLRVHFEQTKEALNPANLFKDGVKEAFHNSSFQTTAAKSLLSLAFGYFTKKLITKRIITTACNIQIFFEITKKK